MQLAYFPSRQYVAYSLDFQLGISKKLSLKTWSKNYEITNYLV